MSDTTVESPTLFPSRAVKVRYGCICDMTLWRWQRSPKVGFPEPIVINGRKYWRASDLDAFDGRQAEASTAA